MVKIQRGTSSVEMSGGDFCELVEFSVSEGEVAVQWDFVPFILTTSLRTDERFDLDNLGS